MTDSPTANFSQAYGVEAPRQADVGGVPAMIGRQGDGTWVAEAQSPSGGSFSLQADSALTEAQMVEIMESVR